MTNILRASAGGMTEQESLSGPESYPTGGFSVRSNLGRVNNVIVDGDSDTYEYEASSIDDNNAFVVQAWDRSDGTEAGAGTDLSEETVTYSAARL